MVKKFVEKQIPKIKVKSKTKTKKVIKRKKVTGGLALELKLTQDLKQYLF